MKKINVFLILASLTAVSFAVESSDTIIFNNTNRDITICGTMARNSYSQNPQIAEGTTPVAMTLAPYSKHKLDMGMKLAGGKIRVTAVLGGTKLSNTTEAELPGSYEITLGSGNMLRAKPLNALDMGKVSMAH